MHLQNIWIYNGGQNGCCLAYIGNTSNLDSNHYGRHCISVLVFYSMNEYRVLSRIYSLEWQRQFLHTAYLKRVWSIDLNTITYSTRLCLTDFSMTLFSFSFLSIFSDSYFLQSLGTLIVIYMLNVYQYYIIVHKKGSIIDRIFIL